MSTLYSVVFDISMQSAPLWVLGVAFAVTAFGLVALWRRYMFGGIVMCCFGLVTASAFWWKAYQLARWKTALKEGRATIAEGPVRQFSPMPAGGHGVERFCVSDKCFVYSENEITAAYHQTATAGGQIRDGVLVRISYVDNAILRVEVRHSG